MSRKEASFGRLVRYMDRDVTSGHGRRVLFHNLFSHEKTPSEQIIEDFRRNAEYLRQRKNGNALYHEILSFSTGYRVQVDALVRAIADIGQEYLNQRAPDQLGYGVVHLDKDHAHLHLCISANRADAPDRVRLAKAEFAKVQQRIEAIVLERYPELAQGKVYDKERQAERIKSRRAEQEMRRHRGVASDKEQLTQRLHAIFELAQSADELVALLKGDGFTLYQRGKTVGIREIGDDGRRYRLNTLGALEHYEATKARIEGLQQTRTGTGKTRGQDVPRDASATPGRENSQERDSGQKNGLGDMSSREESPYRHKPEPERFGRPKEDTEVTLKEWFNRHKHEPEKDPGFFTEVVRLFITGELPKRKPPLHEPEKRQSVVTETIYEFLTGDIKGATPSEPGKVDKSATIKQMIADEVARQMRVQSQQPGATRPQPSEAERRKAELDKIVQANTQDQEKDRDR